MTLAGSWIAFPLVLVLVCAGWGLIVEQLTGERLPGALLPALGLAALAALLTVTSSAVPDLGLTIVVAGAAAGLGLCAIGHGPRDGLRSLVPSGPAATVALGAFALYAAPVVLSGDPAVSGYIRLDDTPTFLGLGDWVFQHGRSTAGLPQSSYEASLQLYLAGGYPVGSMLPLAAVGRIGGHELMWLWMPYIAVLGASLAVAIESIIRPLAPDSRVRVSVAVLASGSALLFGYMLWGGIKEVWTAALAAVVAALVPWTLRTARAQRPAVIARRLVPMAVGTAGILSALSVAGAVWTAPAFAVLAVAAVSQSGRDRRVPLVASAALGLGLALLPLVRQVPFVRGLSQAPTSGPEWLGNLVEPVATTQILGIWPADDFRIDPVGASPTALLLAAAGLGAAWGLARALRERSWGVLAYSSVLVSAATVLSLSGWAWAEAKALAIASPVALALAGAAAAQLLASRRRLRPVGALLLAVLAVGVLWSDVLGIRGTTLTPYDRHSEQIEIGERFAGRGPALFPEYDPYATRWFLRRLDAEGAGALRRRTIPLVNGDTVQKGESADIDRFALDALADFRLIVVRRSPLASRPPSSFSRVWTGRWYDVWERDPAAREVIEHLGLGTALDPGAVPACSEVRRLAAVSGAGGTLIAARARRPAIAGLDSGTVPAGWAGNGDGTVLPYGDGTALTSVGVPSAGRYEVWLGGAFRGEASITVDGVRVGNQRHQLSYPGQMVPFGTAELSAGAHAVSVRLEGGLLQPGIDGIGSYVVGPVALVATTDATDLIEFPSRDADRLCGRRLDWVEAAR